jgi:hypothetical protein
VLTVIVITEFDSNKIELNMFSQKQNKKYFQIKTYFNSFIPSHLVGRENVLISLKYCNQSKEEKQNEKT